MTPKNEYTVRRKPLPRIVLYPQDVVAFTGLHERTARRMLNIVRAAFGKQPFEMVTVREFSQVFGIDEDLIQEFIC